MSQRNTSRPERLPITNIDRNLIEKVRRPGRYKDIAVEISKTVERQGWISPRQREILVKVANRPVRSASLHRGRGTYPTDYDEADWEINAYDLCIDGWGD